MLYGLHFLLFHDFHHIAIYLVGDIAFVPLEVLLVTVVIHQLLARHEKQAMFKKLNMVVGAFFSEVGTELLHLMVHFDAGEADTAARMQVNGEWTPAKFREAARHFREHPHDIDPAAGDLPALRELLLAKREFSLRLLENPNLLEHDRFTDLLWAVFHLTEELASRRDLASLPVSDLDHLAGDIRRAYGLILSEWLAYMQHLQADYPYLFSLAVRMNPFNKEVSPIVE